MSHPTSPAANASADVHTVTRHGVCNLCEAICGLTFELDSEDACGLVTSWRAEQGAGRCGAWPARGAAHGLGGLPGSQAGHRCHSHPALTQI